MEDPRIVESLETVESSREENMATHTLDTATFQPEAAVEQTQSYEQAKAIQSSFKDVVESSSQSTSG